MKTSERVNILVVDDVPEKVMAIEAILEGLGQNIVKAYSGREALRCLLKEDFAVILLDVNMPDMDGFEAAALIRQRKRSEHTPIIFVTAFTDESYMTKGYSLGAVDYIATPVDPEVLRTKVGVFVDLFQKAETIRLQADHRVQLAREQAARQIAEEGMRRSSLLAEASGLLSRSLDYDATLINIHRAVVPALAESCELVLCNPNGELRRACLKADDAIDEHPAGNLPAQQERVDPLLTRAVRAAIDARRTRSTCDGTVCDPAASGAREKGKSPDSIIVPMVARDVPIGALICGRQSWPRRFEPADIALAEDLAGRAATALDNARLYQAIREGERRKDEFLAMLGHELRNPLAAITNAGELTTLLDPADPTFQKSLEIIRQQASLMKRLVDDLLDVSRITSGRIQLQKSVVDVHDVCARVVEAVDPLFKSRAHELHLSLPAETIHVEADPFRLEQILSNLMVNAAKYTDPGGKVWFSAARENGEALFRIKDTGIGIGPDLLPRVFDLFAQADRSLHRSEGGLGIGLTVVHALTELHGGYVSVHSDGMGHGAEFVVRLPALPLAPVPIKPQAAGAQIENQPRRILVVEDQPAILRVTVALLRQLGHEVRGAATGPEAVAAALERPPEVVFLDIGLPEMDGYEVARQLRARMGDSVPLLVATTGYGQLEDRRRSREAGFDHHLVKPVSLAALQQVLSDIEVARQTRRETVGTGG